MVTIHPDMSSKERFNVTESFFYDRLVKDDRRTTRPNNRATKNASNGWGQSTSSQLDRRKRYLSWGDEDPDSSGEQGEPNLSSSMGKTLQGCL